MDSGNASHEHHEHQQPLSKIHRIDQESDHRPIAIKCIAVLIAKYENLPRELWDLCRSYGVSLKEKRTLSLKPDIPDEMLDMMLTTQRVDISGINIDDAFPTDRTIGPLPGSVKMLQTGDTYNKPLVFPSGIQEVHLGQNFDQDLTGSPHHCLRQFTKVGPYSHPLCLPEGVVEATLLFGDYDPEPGMHPAPPPLRLPTTLRKLKVDTVMDRPLTLPPLLKSLTWDNSAGIGALPESLEELVVCHTGFNHPLGELPESLRVLDLDYTSFDHPLEFLPEGLKEIVLPANYTHDLDMPDGLEVAQLYLSEEYAHPIILPYGLRELYLEEDLPIELPPALVVAKFGVSFNKPLVFPPTIKEVFIRNPVYTHKIVVPQGCRVRRR